MQPLLVLKAVLLSGRHGEAVTIIGPSGAGKSTLLGCINFLEEFQEGSIMVEGQPVGYQAERAKCFKAVYTTVVASPQSAGARRPRF